MKNQNYDQMENVTIASKHQRVWQKHVDWWWEVMTQQCDLFTVKLFSSAMILKVKTAIKHPAHKGAIYSLFNCHVYVSTTMVSFVFCDIQCMPLCQRLKFFSPKMLSSCHSYSNRNSLMILLMTGNQSPYI